jgi:hypothetical protein
MTPDWSKFKVIESMTHIHILKGNFILNSKIKFRRCSYDVIALNWPLIGQNLKSLKFIFTLSDPNYKLTINNALTCWYQNAEDEPLSAYIVINGFSTLERVVYTTCDGNFTVYSNVRCISCQSIFYQIRVNQNKCFRIRGVKNHFNSQIEP